MAALRPNRVALESTDDDEVFISLGLKDVA